ncbi:MAG: hypothetical protein ACRCV6_01515 [Formosimonas sp.]
MRPYALTLLALLLNPSVSHAQTAQTTGQGSAVVATNRSQVNINSNNTTIINNYAKEKSDETNGLLSQALIISLAQRINADVHDLPQALKELDYAIRIALVQIKNGQNSNSSNFIDQVLKTAAQQLQSNQLPQAADSISQALAKQESEWAKTQQQQHEQYIQQRTQLLEAGINYDRLNRNAPAAAAKIQERINLNTKPSEQWAALRKEQGQLQNQGTRHGALIDLELATELAQLLIQTAPDSKYKAAAQNDLGTVLQTLGERQSGAAAITSLQAAKTAYENALRFRTRDSAPMDWAMTQNNLGTVQQTLGERQNEFEAITSLQAAQTAYENALQFYTRNSAPMDWAMTQNNLGVVLQTLGGRQKGISAITSLHEAQTAYKNALLFRTRDHFPMDWAATQNNLGIVLRNLSEHQNSTTAITSLQAAQTAYENALQFYTRDSAPMDWAMTQNNLGVALRALGERQSGAEQRASWQAAERHFEWALLERTEQSAPAQFKQTSDNLKALRELMAKNSAKP